MSFFTLLQTSFWIINKLKKDKNYFKLLLCNKSVFSF